MTLYAIATFFLVYSIYLQSALGFTALQAGLAILPFSVGFLTGSTASPRIGRWTGQAAPSLGFLLSAAGAIGISVPTMVRVIVERVEPDHAGLVGGMASSTLQLSSAVGIAVLGGLFYNAVGIRNDPAAVTHAFALTLLAIAACHLSGAFLAVGLGQRHPFRRQCPA